MKDEISIFIVAMCVIAVIGIGAAFVGIITLTIQIMRDNVSCGIVCIFLNLFLIFFVCWAIGCGVIKPLKENRKKER